MSQPSQRLSVVWIHRLSPNLIWGSCAATGIAAIGLAGLASTAAPAIADSTRFALQHSNHNETPSYLLAQATPNADPSPVIDASSEVKKVADLQNRLKKLGYYDGPLDGDYGEQTRAAISTFQNHFNLPVNGQVDATTWQRLKDATQIDGAPAANAQPDASPSVELTQNESTQKSDKPAPTVAKSGPNWRWWLVIGFCGAATLVGIFLYQRQQPRLKTLKQLKHNHSDTTSGLRDDPSQPDHPAQDLRLEESRAGVEAANTPAATDADTPPTPANPSQNHALSTAVNSLEQVSPTTRIPKVNLVDELLSELNSADPAKRRKAIWELGQHGNSEAIQPLVDLMVDSDSSQRSLILAAISEIGIRTLKPMNRALLISLQDQSSDVRKNAIRDITRIYDQITQISNLLNHAASDPDAEVRETARWALGQLNRIRGISGSIANGLPDSVKSPESLPAGADSPIANFSDPGKAAEHLHNNASTNS
jgi:hypothetical protein